jgi:hypothetical protein
MTVMSTMPDAILEKEARYLSQMANVRAIVSHFAEEKGWDFLRRGRHAHASIHGHVGEFNGVIDIQMNLVNWDNMPECLSLDYPFELWSSATWPRNDSRFFADRELLWQVQFGDLEKYTPLFLKRSWEMLEALTSEDFMKTWPWPDLERPRDVPPTFGPPRIATRIAPSSPQ